MHGIAISSCPTLPADLGPVGGISGRFAINKCRILVDPQFVRDVYSHPTLIQLRVGIPRELTQIRPATQGAHPAHLDAGA